MPDLTVGELQEQDLRCRMARGGLYFETGPFVTRLQSPIPPFARSFQNLYAHYPVVDDSRIADFTIQMSGSGGMRRWFRRQAIADIDFPTPFVPMAEAHAQLMFEMGLNWAVASRTLRYLIFHAAVVEKNGRAVIIPGMSGQGKSTLCAGLIHSGWRYFSDEFAMIDFDDLSLIPYPRPLSLKNQSISVIRDHFPEAEISNSLTDTPKGTVAYIRPAREMMSRVGERAQPAAIIFPNYQPDSEAEAYPLKLAEAFLVMTMSSVNYDRFGETSFDALSKLIDQCGVYNIHYPDLKTAIQLVEDVAA